MFISETRRAGEYTFVAGGTGVRYSLSMVGRDVNMSVHLSVVITLLQFTKLLVVPGQFLRIHGAHMLGATCIFMLCLWERDGSFKRTEMSFLEST